MGPGTHALLRLPGLVCSRIPRLPAHAVGPQLRAATPTAALPRMPLPTHSCRSPHCALPGLPRCCTTRWFFAARTAAGCTPTLPPHPTPRPTPLPAAPSPTPRTLWPAAAGSLWFLARTTFIRFTVAVLLRFQSRQRLRYCHLLRTARLLPLKPHPTTAHDLLPTLAPGPSLDAFAIPHATPRYTAPPLRRTRAYLCKTLWLRDVATRLRYFGWTPVRAPTCGLPDHSRQRGTFYWDYGYPPQLPAAPALPGRAHHSRRAPVTHPVCW